MYLRQNQEIQFCNIGMTDLITQPFPFSAFLLAGGIGSRLKTVVSDRPKPMALIGDQPFLEILIESLAQKGIQRIVLLTGYMSEHIETFAHKYRSSDISIEISRETTPLGTGGAVKNAQQFATNPTLLVNGDTYFDADIARLFEFHNKTDAIVTLSLCKVPDVSRYGSVLLKPSGMIQEFQEKSEISDGPGLINAGFSMVSYDLISNLPDNKVFSMEKDIFPSLVSSGSMYGLEQTGAFFDIGTPHSYAEFIDFIYSRQKRCF